MDSLVALLLILLPACHSQSNLDCPEEDIKKGAKTKDFLLTGSETKIYFSKKGETRFGSVKFEVKCMEEEKFWLEIFQENREVKQINSVKDVPLKGFFLTDPAQMTFSHLGNRLNISILDKDNTWRMLVEGVSLSPDHRNCTLHAETYNHYVVWFPCQHSGSPQANLWYLLLLPVFLALFVLLFFYREKLMKFFK